MKRCIITYFWVSFIAIAQNNTPVPITSTSHKPPVEVNVSQITAKSAEFNIKSNLVIFIGNVQIVAPRLNLTCERLEALISPTNKTVESMTATGTVTFLIVDAQNKQIKGRAGTLIYKSTALQNATNETIELLANPVLETDQGSLIADRIIFDRTSGQVNAENARMLMTTQENAPNHIPMPQILEKDPVIQTNASSPKIATH